MNNIEGRWCSYTIDEYIERSKRLTKLESAAKSTMIRFYDCNEIDAMEFDFEPLKSVLKESSNA